jgi:hypothetical protein
MPSVPLDLDAAAPSVLLDLDAAAHEVLNHRLVDHYPTLGDLKAFLINDFPFAKGQLAETVSASALNIVEYAVSRGYVSHLIRQLRRRHGSDAELKDLERRLLPPLTTEALQPLERSVGGELNEDEVREFERVAATLQWAIPPRASNNDGPARRFLQILDRLTENCEKLKAVLEEFSHKLQNPSLARAIGDWAQANMPDVMGASSSLAAGSPSEIYVFLRCDSGTASTIDASSRVDLSAYMWRLGANGVPLDAVPQRILDPTTTTLAAIWPTFIAVIDRADVAAQLQGSPAEPIIELCLRRNLISHGDFAREWTVRQGELTTRLGDVSPVVLRCFERIYEQNYRGLVQRLWKRRWEQLRLTGDATARVHFVDETELVGDAWHTKLPKDVLGLVARRWLPTSADLGLPVALWWRDEAPPLESRRLHLAPFLGDLMRLPRRLFDEGLLDRVALLWDAFDRIPPDSNRRFAAPAKT